MKSECRRSVSSLRIHSFFMVQKIASDLRGCEANLAIELCSILYMADHTAYAGPQSGFYIMIREADYVLYEIV